MTVKWVQKQVLDDTGWLKGIYVVWGHYKDTEGFWLNPKKIPQQERPYIVSYCERCQCQRLLLLCDSTKDWLVFECTYCNNGG